MVMLNAAMAADYTAEKATVDGMEIVRLVDPDRQTEVSIVPGLGNNAFEMKVKGKNIFWSPYTTLRQWQEKPTMLGNPFLAPWANRIDGDSYWVNGRKYTLQPALENFRYDSSRQPIHGLLVYAKDWKVISLRADSVVAEVTSRLEFWRRPDWMAQFPFAHSIEMTYRLKGGVLEVETAIENLCAQDLPLSLGYHTYYRLDDAVRNDWTVHVSAREHQILSEKLIPTGEKKAVTLADRQSLNGLRLDDVFTDLIRDDAGRAEFSVRGRTQKIRVLFGAKFDVAVVYSPQDRDFICFEPMVGLTNAFNLAQRGIYKQLQSVAPGGRWKESFWICPEGF